MLREGGGEAMAAPAAAGEELSERYLWYLEVGGTALAEALLVLSEPASYPWSSTAPPARTVPACWPPWCWTSWALTTSRSWPTT